MALAAEAQALGLEGGVTNGEELRAQAVVKPIPTLLQPVAHALLQADDRVERIVGIARYAIIDGGDGIAVRRRRHARRGL